MIRRLLLIVFAVLLFTHVPPAAAQNVYVSTPYVNMTDSFYEWYGIDWGYRSRGPNGSFFFNRGSSQGTIPPFGGYDPASAARLGFASNGFFFNLTAAQGSNRTITSTTPSVNVYNGAVGSVRDVQMRPFVTGLIPVVGSGSGYRVPPPTLISPLKQRLARLREESAQRARQPVAANAVVANDAGANVAANHAANDDAITPDLVLGPAQPTTSPTHVARTGSSASTAQRGDISVAEIRRRQASRAAEATDELDRLIEEAKAAELVGRFGAARVRYKQAAARATGDLQRVLLEKLDSIRDR